MGFGEIVREVEELELRRNFRIYMLFFNLGGDEGVKISLNE